MSKDKESKTFLLFLLMFCVAGILFISFKNINKLRTDTDQGQSMPKQGLIVFGDNSFGQLGLASYDKDWGFNTLKWDAEISEVAAGRNYSLALTKDGKVLSWGGNEWGQLGYKVEGTYYNPNPREINSIDSIVKVSASNNHTLALRKDGSVYAFGSNFTGQLGDGTNTDNPIPRLVPDLKEIKDIAAGYKFSLALSDDGTVWGWGASCDNTIKKEAEVWWKNIVGSINSIDGGYYDPTSDALAQYDKNEYCINEEVIGLLTKSPKKINNLENIDKISAGYGHGIALSKNGEIWTFGCNTYNQLGRDTKGPENAIPQKLTGITNVKEISAGFRHSLALKSDGTLWGWGMNNHGQLGLKTNEDMQINPIKIPIEGVVTIIAGYDYSLALKNDGTLWGWGMNRQKLFEDSEKEFISEPVKLKNFEGIKQIAASGAHLIALSN